MPPTQTPAPLTTIWSVSHGLGTFYQGEQILADDGLLLMAAEAGFSVGLTSVVFDDDTGEPLAFQSNAAISLATAPSFLGVWHFPLESCVVVAGYKVGTAADARLWARRVYYDTAGNFTTPDPLTTWSPSLTAAGVPVAVGCASSSSLNAIWFSTSSCKTTTLDLAAGTVGTVTTQTLSSIFGGSIDRVQLCAPLLGEHADASVLCTAYVNASGAATAQTYVVAWAGGTPTSANVSTSRATSMGSGPPDVGRTLLDVGGLGGGPRRLTAPGGSPFLDVQEPNANFIYSSTNRTTRVIPGTYDSHNREDLTYGTVSGSNDKLRVRQWTADTGAEIYAWEYPGSIGSHPYTGRLVKRGQFWFTRSTTIFSVHEGDFPGGRKWWVGVAGWGG